MERFVVESGPKDVNLGILHEFNLVDGEVQYPAVELSVEEAESLIGQLRTIIDEQIYAR